MSRAHAPGHAEHLPGAAAQDDPVGGKFRPQGTHGLVDRCPLFAHGFPSVDDQGRQDADQDRQDLHGDFGKAYGFAPEPGGPCPGR